MQPKMHCRVEGKLFAAVIDRQKTDVSLTLRAGLPGMTLDSGAIRSSSALPESSANHVIKMRYSKITGLCAIIHTYILYIYVHYIHTIP